MFKILFLGYSKRETRLIQFLRSKKNINLTNTKKKLNLNLIQKFDFVICFGYRHIIDQSILKNNKIPIVNLHIGYLPYNRGAHPNFWSFYDNTPSGVTIHLIDSGVDTGPIVKQRYVNFDESDDTFVKTYSVLIENIENLFLEFLPSLLNNTWIAKKQRGIGTHHFIRELPSNFSGWNSNISQELTRLDKEGLKYDGE